jgi:2-polyprenyl-3-methyl-5-hydroxy-6-metoxy-1,4-benzoquinol methylase
VTGLVDRLQAGIDVLDVGCGEGAFGRLVKQHRTANVWGVEVIPEIASKAADGLDAVLVTDIEKSHTDLPADFFDCIVCNDILEHLINPWAALQALRTKLASRGRVVASIPNVRHYPNVRELLVNASWRYRDHGVLDITHLRFFTMRSIQDMFAAAGYKVETIKGIRASRMSRKFEALNALLLSNIDDMRYERFAVVAIPNP